jgi:hypothetical protein
MAKASPAARLGQARSKGGVSRSLEDSKLEREKSHERAGYSQDDGCTTGHRASGICAFERSKAGTDPRAAGWEMGTSVPACE